MADIKQAIEYAKQNPESAFATELRTRIESGKMNTELTSAGLPPVEKAPGFGKKVVEDIKKRGQNIKEGYQRQFAGEQEIPETGVQIAGNIIGGVGDIVGEALSAITPDKLKEYGADQIRKLLEKTGGIDTIEKYNAWSAKHPRASANVDAVVNIASVLPVSKAGTAGLDLLKGGAKKTVAKNIEKGLAKQAVEDFAKNVPPPPPPPPPGAPSIIKQGVDKTKALLKGTKDSLTQASDDEIKAGLRAETPDADLIDVKNPTTPAQKKIIQTAKTQGIEDKDIELLSSMSKPDREDAIKMIQLADKANTDRRVLERPIDIAGSTLVEKIKIPVTNQKVAGEAVNTTAKALKGQALPFEAREKFRDSIINTLDDAGITIEGDKLNFKDSVFKNVPALQKELQKVLSSIPDGEDAYQFHIFKKSVDELVDFGTKGEGLKGSSKRILKNFRRSADEALDDSFPEYNAANTEFKNARDITEFAEDLFGKKFDITGKNADVRAGQILRSAFSNNASRSKVYELAKLLDGYEKLKTGKVSKNALDQALFAEVLDKSGLYDTQAITGLAGQVETAVKKAKTLAEGLRDPIKGAGTVAANIVEKVQNINPKRKREILEALLK